MSAKRLLSAITILALCTLSCQVLAQAIASPTPVATHTLTPTDTITDPIAAGWSNWLIPSFMPTDKAHWSQSQPGSYTATGSENTFAWSEQALTGDLILSLDIEGTDSLSQAVIVIYGDGKGWSTGNLVIIIGGNEQSIKAHEYEGMESLLDIGYENIDFKTSRHTVTIEIINRVINLYVDEKKLGLTTELRSNVNQNGQIGLYKLGERPEITYSNLKMKYRPDHPPSTVGAKSAPTSVAGEQEIQASRLEDITGVWLEKYPGGSAQIEIQPDGITIFTVLSGANKGYQDQSKSWFENGELKVKSDGSQEIGAYKVYVTRRDGQSIEMRYELIEDPNQARWQSMTYAPLTVITPGLPATSPQPAATSTPTFTPEPGRIYESEGGFSYVPPEGWQVKEAPGMEYQVLAGNPAGDFVPNLFFFVSQAHQGSLDKFVSESMDYNLEIIPDLKTISQEDFMTSEGARGVKIVVESTQRNLRVRQTYYFFEVGAKKLTATYTRLANAGQGNDLLVDQSMKTFRSEAAPNERAGIPEKTSAPTKQVILIAKQECAKPKITSADEVIVRVRWGAKTVELAEANAGHFTFVFLLDGKNVGDIRSFRQPAETYSSLERYGCSSGDVLGWVHWDVPVGQLPAGKHTVSVNYILDEPISDGLEVYSAGPFGFFEVAFEVNPE